MDKTPHDISVAAAKRMMPNLLGLVNDAHEAFQNAESTVQEINDRLDHELQAIVLQEKTANDHLCKAKEDLAKLEERGKTLENERSDLERELSNHEEHLRRDEKFLDEKKGKLKGSKTGRVVNAATSTAGTIFRGILTGGAEVVVGAAVGGITAAAIEKDIKKFEDVSRASEQVSNTQRRITDKKRELSNLDDEKAKQRENHKTKSKELETIKLRKEEIKKILRGDLGD